MLRLKNIVPSYRKHKQSGQAIVTLSGRDYLLGPYGTEASRQKYDRLIAKWVSSGRQPLSADDTGLTIGEAIAAHWAQDVRPRFEPLKRQRLRAKSFEQRSGHCWPAHAVSRRTNDILLLRTARALC